MQQVSMSSQDESHDILHDELQARTESLLEEPANPARYLARAEIYQRLKYPDLAAADAYKALAVIEKLLDSEDEDFGHGEDSNSDDDKNNPYDTVSHTGAHFETLRYSGLKMLVLSLVKIGCLQDAYRFYMQIKGFSASTADDDLMGINNRFNEVKIGELPNSGFVRRDIYYWNNHEPDRHSADAVAELNHRLRAAAPLLEVRVTSLPTLHSPNNRSNESGFFPASNLQLGLFAKANLEPGCNVLTEVSPLTATTASDSSLCDCCRVPLPALDSASPPVACPSCDDTVFCSPNCYSIAHSLYHSSVCGDDAGLDQIGRGGTIADRSDNLYLLLIARTISMAEAQSIHPLDLPDVKYLWGDFGPQTLPFTFHFNIIMPLQILEATRETTNHNTFPFSASSLSRYDSWVINTLYAKFRAVASAKQSTWDGAPEVSAVHPLWCLANHSCTPNVRWNWEGSIEFWVRTSDELVDCNGKESESVWEGIKAGEEILNHYCDVRLPVKERREWAIGALGGACQCKRCKSEADEESTMR